jgi:hypothetical protein
MNGDKKEGWMRVGGVDCICSRRNLNELTFYNRNASVLH